MKVISLYIYIKEKNLLTINSNKIIQNIRDWSHFISNFKTNKRKKFSKQTYNWHELNKAEQEDLEVFS